MKIIALTFAPRLSRLTRQYSATPRKPNQMFTTLMPQKAKPAVSKNAMTEAALALAFGRKNSAVQIRQTSAAFRNAPEKPP